MTDFDRPFGEQPPIERQDGIQQEAAGEVLDLKQAEAELGTQEADLKKKKPSAEIVQFPKPEAGPKAPVDIETGIESEIHNYPGGPRKWIADRLAKKDRSYKHMTIGLGSAQDQNARSESEDIDKKEAA